jgi:hypothetical protein
MKAVTMMNYYLITNVSFYGFTSHSVRFMASIMDVRIIIIIIYDES